MQHLQSQKSVWAASIHPQLRRNPKIAEKLTLLSARIEVSFKKDISLETIAVQHQRLLAEIKILVEALQKAKVTGRNTRLTEENQNKSSARDIYSKVLDLPGTGSFLLDLPKSGCSVSMSPEQYAYMDILTLLSFEIDFAVLCKTLIYNSEIEVSRSRQVELDQFLINKSRRYTYFLNEFNKAKENVYALTTEEQPYK